MKRATRSTAPGKREAGAALLEFVLCLPLVLVVVYGLLTLTALIRAKYQVVLVAHAVMREAVTGADPQTLNALAKVYARAAGGPRLRHLWVSVESAADPFPDTAVLRPQGTSRVSRYLAAKRAGDQARWRASYRPWHRRSGTGRFAQPAVPPLIAKLVASSRVRVQAVVPVYGPLSRLWPAGLPVEYTSVYLRNPWKGSIMSRVGQLLKRFSGGAS